MKTREFAEKVLEQSDKPLSYRQIWEKGQELGLDKELDYKGKTDPWQNIYALLSQDITYRSEESVFCKYSSNPVLFGLKRKEYSKAVVGDAIEEEETVVAAESEDYNEADLHVPLVSYLSSSDHFMCYTKTIRQQKSKRAKKGIDQWTYPDLIGVRFPYNEYDYITLTALDQFMVNAVKVFSFEVKKELTAQNIRECYFQAVSNSSWANEGYLVAADISDDPSFLRELDLLNNAFGIGIIKIDVEEIEKSSIVKTARYQDTIEVNMLNKLIERSDEVREVFRSIEESRRLKRVVDNGTFDKRYEYDEYYEAIAKNGLKGISGRKK